MDHHRLSILVVADGEPLLARGLALLLEAHSWLEVTAAHSLRAGRRTLVAEPVDVVLLFADEADEALVGWARELRAVHSRTAVCLLISRADLDALQGLMVDEAGHVGVVLRADDLDGPEIVRTIRDAVIGRATLERHQLERLVSRNRAREGRLHDLTDAEREILRLMAVGLRNRVIARRLWKSEKAVEKSVSQIFTKLGLSTAATSHLDRRVMATRIYLHECDVARRRGAVGRAPGERGQPTLPQLPSAQ